MRAASGELTLGRGEWKQILSLFALALCVQITVALAALQGSAISLDAFGVWFDGHLYIEIAKSFPLPYSGDGREYLGQAPGYPALVYLGRLITPDLLNWGLLAVLLAWISGALAAAAFYLLCRETGTPPLWPSVLFVVANPAWLAVAATPHPEPLAMLFVILCFLAFVRGSLAWAAFWLSLAALTRFPAILLGASLAFMVLMRWREVSVREILILGSPLVVLGLYNLYLYWHVPAFEGIWAAHSFWWDAHWTWPFSALIETAPAWIEAPGFSLFELTYVSLALYLLSMVVGFRAEEREHWFLPLWVGVLVLFHASLAERVAATDFTRLVVLGWPAALLILWRWIGREVHPLGMAAGCTAAALFAIWFSTTHVKIALFAQSMSHPYLEDSIRRLNDDQPRWVDFRGMIGARSEEPDGEEAQRAR